MALAFFGCTKSENATSSTQTTSTQTTSTTATTATVAPVSQTTATTATTSTTVAVPPSTGAVASTEGETPGVRIDVTELKRMSGGTINLKWVVVNNSAERFSRTSEFFGDRNVSADHYHDVSGVHLIDPVNKKKYFVVTDAEKKCVCSKDIFDRLEPGVKANLWAKFPAPPPEVTKVTIEIPHFQPMDDVPISQ
ncbi:MAG: hypothetical protein M3041_13760 [Acidobacteriota bacterium]|nr:hypothetical protein [Acidobacteriota bacterium]